jgi:lipoprotein-anchoring transpeptidase ErfK/SrfK
MKNAFALPVLILLALPCASARAQGYNSPEVPIAGPPPPAWRPTQSQAPDLGGGLIELLVTGSAPGPAPRRTTPPVPYGQPAGRYGVAPIGLAPQRSSAIAYAPAPAEAYARQRPVLSEPEPQFRRREVEYHGPRAPGTIVIDTPDKFLFLIEPGGRAIRYGIGVGRPGFEWAGVKSITRKAEWPGWTPPSEMLKRRPDLPAHMEGGLGNPLGARALYLGSTLYRIHGTNEPETIGKSVSSGCIRMLNEDVEDLYERVKIGTRVLII